MNKNNYISLAAAVGLITSMALAGTAFAQTQVSANVNVGANVHAGFEGNFRSGPGPAMIPGIFGTVASVNGTSLTVNSKMGKVETEGHATSTAVLTVYTVDGSNAQVIKNATTSSVSAIAVGDTVMVQGTISGTNVTAKIIRDGVMQKGMPGMWGGEGNGHNGTSTHATSTPIITGNGEPVVGGSITAISGNTITVTTKTNIVYTIDASNSTIVKNGTSTAIANIATGDNVVIQGAVNGTSITASSIIDQGGSASSTSAGGGASVKGHFAFFGAIGSFFQHLFGF